MSTASIQPETSQSKKKGLEATAIGSQTAIARSVIMQAMRFWYRTPIKVQLMFSCYPLSFGAPGYLENIFNEFCILTSLHMGPSHLSKYCYTNSALFRPLRVDYMIIARALMPVDQNTRTRFSIRYSSLGILANAVKVQGWQFIPRHVLPPLLANTVIGTVLYATYIATLSTLHPATSFQKYRTFPSPPFSSVFMAGAIAGAAQAVVATPMDSLKVRFEVTDLLEGKHRSMWTYARDTLRALGLSSAYRGFTLTLAKDSLACGLFFATFEWVKQQGYYFFLHEVYGVHFDSNSVLEKRKSQAAEERVLMKIKPHFMIEPLFIMLAGAAAVVAYQVVEYPLSRIHSIFWIEEAKSEFPHPQSRKTTGALYRQTWTQAKLQVQRFKGSWRRFLYHGFGGTVARSIPATSIGFLVFELVKRHIDQREQAKDAVEEMK
ncbi:mitochondrial carrier domain-containing protein [Endogone sp. FLAS-F59071]|nr:mitochondrial carrier domain-containing protein [Endogone sp. FLAS-F59071]|eukprot:RUS21150.1 mitochondrial carrier domain-containing protein [Endogone sp. FLAS-F59071]